MFSGRYNWMPLLLLLLPAIAVAGVIKHVEHKHWTDEYDPYFRKYTKHYFGPFFNWKWFKAQGIAESGLKANARSAVGAKGIMQIMPATYKEIVAKNPHLRDISTPRWNIAAGIYYDRQLYRRWRKQQPLPASEQLNFALASYNAGFGNIRSAFRRANKKHKKIREWTQVAPFAPGETRHYVKRINGLMQLED